MPYTPTDWSGGDEVTSAAMDRIELALAAVTALAETLQATLATLSWDDIAAGSAGELEPVFLFKASSSTTPRPTVAGNVALLWDLGVDATTPPINMTDDDYWLS